MDSNLGIYVLSFRIYLEKRYKKISRLYSNIETSIELKSKGKLEIKMNLKEDCLEVSL